MIWNSDTWLPRYKAKPEFHFFLGHPVNWIEIMNIWIWLLITQKGVCSIRVIPITNLIHSVNVPYEVNKNQILQRFKNINEASTFKVVFDILKSSYISYFSYVGEKKYFASMLTAEIWHIAEGFVEVTQICRLNWRDVEKMFQYGLSKLKS